MKIILIIITVLFCTNLSAQTISTLNIDSMPNFYISNGNYSLYGHSIDLSDTVEVLMEVSDTSHYKRDERIWINDCQFYDIKAGERYDIGFIKHQFGYGVLNYYGGIIGYMDKDRKPLPDNIVVWNSFILHPKKHSQAY